MERISKFFSILKKLIKIFSILFVSIILCYFCHLAIGTQVVSVPVLNVRTCSSTNCDIITKLNKGDTVDIVKEYESWVEIKTADKKQGFVIKKSLDYNYFAWVILFLVLCVFIWRWTTYLNNRCPGCKKSTLQQIEKKCIEKHKTNIKTTLYTYHKDGKTSRKEVLVPATAYTYEITKKCSNCGHITNKIIKDTVKD